VGNSYKYLIVNWGGHIAHAAFAIEQKNRAEEVFGPLATFLGFHPFKLESFPAPYGKKPKYEESYYWKEYTSLPQFDDFAKSGSVFKIFIKVRAVSTTLRVLAIAGLIALPGFSRRRFFLSIKNQKVRKLTLGAQIASDFLRNGQICNGRLEIGRDLIRVLYECYLVAHYWLDVAPQIDFRQLLFSNPETTYRNEIARRALLRRGASEIFSDRWAEGRFTLATSHRFGSELSLCRPVSQSPVEIESARKDLLGRLSGNSRYIYMGTEDVDSRRVVQVVDARRAPRDAPRTKAVVFLHCVSDAQFLCGEDDCFADLDDWLNCSLNILLAKGYDVYVKAHPAMFSDYNRRQYPIDGRYAEYLATEKGLDWSGLADGQIARSRDPRIWVVDTKLAIASLKQALGDFVAITHHGTVATEAVGLRIPVVWSNANPARQFPEFGFSYKTVKEYSRLLNLFRQGGLVIDQQRFENCLRYLAASKNDYSVTVWTGFSRLAGQNIFADPDIYDNLVLSADPQRRPRLYAEIQELYGVGSIPSVALWKGEGGSEECRQADINPARRASVPLRT
jgi:hypothetical protein